MPGWDPGRALGDICFTACAWTTVCLCQQRLRAGGLQSPCWGTRWDGSSRGWSKIPHRSFPPPACEQLVAPRSHLLLSRAQPLLTTLVSPGWQSGVGQSTGSEEQGSRRQRTSQLVSQGNAAPAPVSAQAWPDGQLSYHGPEGKQGQGEGKAPLSSIPSSFLQTIYSQLTPRMR